MLHANDAIFKRRIKPNCKIIIRIMCFKSSRTMILVVVLLMLPIGSVCCCEFVPIQQKYEYRVHCPYQLTVVKIASIIKLGKSRYCMFM